MNSEPNNSKPNKIKRNFKFGLFSRMLVALFILLVSALAILSVSLLNNAANQFDGFRLQHAQSMARTLAEGSLDALVTEDYELLERFVKSSLPAHYGAYTYLTRPNGQILSSTDLSLIAKSIIPPKIENNKLSRTLEYKNRPVTEVVYKATIGEQHLANAHVAYYNDQGGFTYFGQAKEIIFALLFILLVILIGTYFIVSRIRTPVLNLINTVINTSHENPIHLPQKLFCRNDEVGTLARTFDDVFTQLSAANKEIKRSYDSLETKVQQRTKQLSDKKIEIEIAQERINAIMDNAGDSIISINSKGIIESFNLAAQNLFGYSINEVQGQNIKILMPEPFSSTHDSYINKYLETGTPQIVGKGAREVIGKRKDGSEFPMELIVNQTSLYNENVFIGIVRDITIEKEAKEYLLHTNELLEEKVRQRTLELKESNKELITTRDAALTASNIKSEFLSTISHELRTPLHSISGYQSLLSCQDLSDEQIKYCDKIGDGANNLLDIITEILDFSSYESGRLEVNNKLFSLEDSLISINKTFNKKAEQKGIKFSYHIEENISDSIYSDSKRLKQILVTFISNAIKFTSKGSVIINVTQIEEENSVPSINFSVTDTGIGIEDSEQNNIFNPFYQVDGSITRAYGGTGIGLALAKKISELLGGNIFFDSHTGQGSTFTFRLPLIENEPDYKESINKNTLEKSDNVDSSIAATNITQAIKNKNIIVVEDNEINAELLLIQLDELGYRADVVENGQVFLDTMKEHHYDLVLMDCQMPILNGYDATEQYRSKEIEGSHIPIIAITANVMTGDREKCLESGMDDYIEKPVNLRVLREKVHYWLDNPQQQSLDG